MLFVVGVFSLTIQSPELGVRGISQGRGIIALLGVSYDVLMNFAELASGSKYERHRILGVRFGMFRGWDDTTIDTVLPLGA